MAAAVLYTPEVLALSIGLAAYPWNEDLPLKAEARSPRCGSTIALGLSIDGAGQIADIGIRSHACAIGQAAASIFAAHAPGRGADELVEAQQAMALWLSGDGNMPSWPGLRAIAPALAYPARHGAILLAWQAARELLCTNDLPR